MNNDFSKDLKYNKDYSWVKIENEVITLGIIEPGVKQVEEFVFIMLPEKGKKLKKGDTYINLEAVKWSGHLSSPVSGEVVDVNMDIFNDPSKINKDPYNNWIIKIKLADTDELNELLDAKGAFKYYQEK